MRSKFLWLLLLVLTGVAISWLFFRGSFISYIENKKLENRPDFISYNETLKILNEGKVKSILIGHTGTYLELKDGTSRSTSIPGERNIYEDISNCQKCVDLITSIE